MYDLLRSKTELHIYAVRGSITLTLSCMEGDSMSPTRRFLFSEIGQWHDEAYNLCIERKMARLIIS